MPQNPIDYLRGLLGRRQPTLGCIAPATVTAPHGTVDHVRQIAEAKAAACREAADVDRSRPPWVRPDPVEGGPSGGYGGGGDEADDEAMTEPAPLERSHKPEVPWPPIPPKGLSILAGTRGGPAPELADTDSPAPQAALYVPGWTPGTRRGIPDYSRQGQRYIPGGGA